MPVVVILAVLIRFITHGAADTQALMLVVIVMRALLHNTC
jgi:hypothetical protein